MLCSAAAIASSGCSGKELASDKTAKETEVKNEQASQSPLNADEKKLLLKIAGDTIAGYVKDRSIPDIENYPLTERLKGPGGAFVTINNAAPSSPVYPAPLRGCIGNFFSSRPLAETVREMAVAACSSDTRFPPVSERELKDIKIEISALSPLRPIDNPLAIKKGVNGIYIKPKHGYGGGTYLPQVWSEHFPDRDAEFFWTHLCEYKAGLPADAWKHPDKYDVMVYTADVFGE